MYKHAKIAAGAAVAVAAVCGTATAATVASHSKQAHTAAKSSFVAITPCRAIDTRKAGGKIKHSQVRNFWLTGTVGFPSQGGVSGGCGIPANTTAVAVSFKVTRPTSVGYLRVWPDSTDEPNATTLTWAKGLSLGDSSIVPVASGPGLSISARVFGDPANIVADVTGYFAP